MYERYQALVTAMKALTQVEDPNAAETATVTLPVAEDEWDVRPDTVSYGLISLDFEAGNLDGDDGKQDRVFGGSADLFSMVRGGAGWIPLIEATLAAYCGPCWTLNLKTYERETGLFHWEWTFEIAG